MTVSFDYDRGYYISEEGALRWMDINPAKVEYYVRHCFSPFDLDHAYNILWKYPIIASKIIKDFFKSDEDKLKKIVDEMVNHMGLVYTIVGDRGSGKTATACYCLEKAHHEGREVFLAGPPQKMPKFMIRVKHPLDCPQGGIVLVDEAATKYFCRDFMYGEQKDLMRILNTLRHTDRTILFVTQTLAATDKMVTVCSDRLIIKHQGIFASKSERKELRDIIQIVKPRTTQAMLFWENTGAFTFVRKMPLAKCWSEAYSKPYTSMAHKPVDAWKMAEELKELDYSPMEIVREMKARSFKTTRQEVEKKLWGEEPNLKPELRKGKVVFHA